MFVIFHHPVRFDHLIDGEDLLDDRHNAAIDKFRQCTPGEFGNDLGFFRYRSGAQHRADDLLALDHHQRQIELGLDAGDDTDDDQLALVGE